MTLQAKRRTKRDSLSRELARRLARPQRHRLLQGYPMAPLLRPVRAPTYPLCQIDPDPSRPLLLGILPHTFCNPKVRGCGFCTFPQEQLSNSLLQSCVEQVSLEIRMAATTMPSLRERHVEAVYFGGGTANLTPPKGLQEILSALSEVFDLSNSELTLEGVPNYFLLREQALLDLVQHSGAAAPRVSVGVQTFDRQWLRRMGREQFGDCASIQQVVNSARRRGLTSSADLLYNLPGETPARALEDVRTAVDLGLDQICMYNLVLNSELDTEWSRDDSLVSAMPDNARACEVWLALREMLQNHGYVQTTLTNFERRGQLDSARWFRYELASFEPSRFDGLGFGPGSISTLTHRDRRGALKWTNVGTSNSYVQAFSAHRTAVHRIFDYSLADLKLLHLTRSLARLRVDRGQYQSFFGSDAVSDYLDIWQVLEEARLLRQQKECVELTPEGMFFADAVVGLLAQERVAQLRAEPDDDASLPAYMG